MVSLPRSAHPSGKQHRPPPISGPRAQAHAPANPVPPRVVKLPTAPHALQSPCPCHAYAKPLMGTYGLAIGLYLSSLRPILPSLRARHLATRCVATPPCACRNASQRSNSMTASTCACTRAATHTALATSAQDYTQLPAHSRAPSSPGQASAPLLHMLPTPQPRPHNGSTQPS
jgi:hypothetical protein